jgi:hypothetical protein
MLTKNQSATVNGITATFTHISGKWGTHSARCHFECVHPHRIPTETLLELQIALGRHPGGYGFFDFAVSGGPTGPFTHTWTCSDNCD